MIDLLNRIGFRQIAFGGESGGGRAAEAVVEEQMAPMKH
jgi:predicted alpha/beta-hydrolase family hydrolase